LHGVGETEVGRRGREGRGPHHCSRRRRSRPLRARGRGRRGAAALRSGVPSAGGGEVIGVAARAPSTALCRFKPYPEYKDSGVEWLGEIPAGWEMLSLKRAARISYGLGEPP